MEVYIKVSENYDYSNYIFNNSYDSRRYVFTVNDGDLGTQTALLNEEIIFSGRYYKIHEGIKNYVKYQLRKDFLYLQEILCLYRLESLEEQRPNILTVFSPIYDMLLPLMESPDGLHITSIYSHYRKNNYSDSYILNFDEVKELLLYLKTVETRDDNLLITEQGKRVFNKLHKWYYYKLKMDEIAKGRTGSPELEGRTICLKCRKPINSVNSSVISLCFSCRREEARLEIETD